MRLFIALNFNGLKDYFSELQKQIPRDDCKLTLPDDFHLTLKFLGEVDETKIEELKQKLNEINFKEFECEVSGIDLFNEKHPRVIWLGVDCDDIYQLQKQIEEKLTEYRKDDFDFKAHITLARVKWCKDNNNFVDKIKEIRTEEKKVKIDKFELVKSVLTPQGPVYDVVKTFS